MVKVNRRQLPSISSIEVCSTLRGDRFGSLTFDSASGTDIGVHGNPSFALSKAEAQDLVDALQELVNQLQ